MTEKFTDRVRSFLNLSELLDLAEALEDQISKNPEIKVERQVQVRSYSSIPKRGSIPRPNFQNQEQTVSVPVRPQPQSSADSPETGIELVGGLDQVLEQLRYSVEIPLKRPDITEKLGLEVPRGILLTGAPGTGKTLVVRTLAQRLGVHFIAVNAPELMGKYYGESEARLRQVFSEAVKHSPCLIFIDEIDAIAPNRNQVEGEVEKRLVAQLLTLMDGCSKEGKIILLAATNRPDSLDPALRRPSRFETEINFPIPDLTGRIAILKIHTRSMPLSEDVQLEEIAKLTAGCVGADLRGICQEAARIALQRQITSLENIPDNLSVNWSDFQQALAKVKPAVLRPYQFETPNVSWAQIGGLTQPKALLQEAVSGALLQAELYQQAKAQAPKGILLYGAPGTGKTLLAKAVATQAQANFIALSGAEILSKWIGESEQTIHQVFAQARQAAPCVIFIDEIDTIAPLRGSYQGDSGVSDRLVGQLLTEIDGLNSSQGVMVIAATNRRESLDPALIRSGRLELQIEVDLPDQASRAEILQVHNHDRPLAEDVDLEYWAQQTAGWNGADLAFLSNRSAIAAIRRHQQLDGLAITQADFHTAFAEIRRWNADPQG